MDLILILLDAFANEIYSISRYDYENCDSAPAKQMMDNLDVFVADSANIGQSYSSGDKTYTIAKIDNFSYTDPVDASVSKNQASLCLMWSQNVSSLGCYSFCSY